MLTLASQPLHVSDPRDPKLAAAIAALDPAEVRPRPARAWPGKGLTGIAFPSGCTPTRPIKVNSFFWPWGASRWAEAWLLASGVRAAAIRDEAFGPDGSQQSLVTLEMTTPGLQSAGEVLSVQLYLAMPPIPIRRVRDDSGGYGVDAGESGLYLLALVDPRFYFWDIPCPDFAIDENATTWASLYTKLGTSIGTTINADPVDPAYRLPSKALNLKDQPLPLVADAVAFNCGQRLIFQYDGSIRAINATTAQSIRQADDSAFKQRNLIGGGDWFADTI